MASLPVNDDAVPGLYQEELPDFVLLRTEEIERGERLRDIDQVWADALGGVMAREGQKTPIEVCRLPGRPKWTVVVGGHRHRGAEIHEIEYLKAEIVSANRDDRRLRRSPLVTWNLAIFCARCTRSPANGAAGRCRPYPSCRNLFSRRISVVPRSGRPRAIASSSMASGGPWTRSASRPDRRGWRRSPWRTRTPTCRPA